MRCFEHVTIDWKMAKRRTKKDKIIAQLRRQVHNKVPFSDSSVSVVEQISKNQPSPKIKINQESNSLKPGYSSLFSYDPAFIRKDLVRTLIWASLAFGIEIGLYFLQR